MMNTSTNSPSHEITAPDGSGDHVLNKQNSISCDDNGSVCLEMERSDAPTQTPLCGSTATAESRDPLLTSQNSYSRDDQVQVCIELSDSSTKSPTSSPTSGNAATYGSTNNLLNDQLSCCAGDDEVHVCLAPPSVDALSVSIASSMQPLRNEGETLSTDIAANQLTVRSIPSGVRMMEVVPPDSRFRSAGTYKPAWKLPLGLFTSRKANLEERGSKGLSRRVKKYYKEQDELIEEYESLEGQGSDDEDTDEEKLDRTTLRLSQISVASNFVLLVIKAVAVAMSGSISIISSMIDSALDLLSGIVFWYTSRAMKRTNLYKYPSGKRRMEPLAIVVLSVILSLASVQLIIESVQKIIGYTTDKSDVPHFEVPTIIITCLTVGTKLALFILCYTLGRKYDLLSGSVGMLVQDHRNDTLSNTVALICGYLGSKEFAMKMGEENVAYIDPAGAIVIGAYILVSWWKKGLEQIRMLTGITAKPEFLSKITWMCLNHSPHILKIDTVRAFHFGSRFLVEVDIVLPRDMNLETTHGIGESLQQKLEDLREVERAFVHCDWQIQDPEVEHRVV